MSAVHPLGPSLQRPKPALPGHLEAEETRDAARLSWRWLRADHLRMGAVGVLWNTILAIVCVKALTRPEPSPAELVFMLPHLGVGLWLLYFSLAGVLNRTTIDVSRERLSIRHGPLPWPGERDLELPGNCLKQLYGEAWRRSQFLFQRAGTVYDLKALDADGHEVELLSGIEDRSQVLYLELALEKQLGIEDAPVEGELATRIPA